jgi:selenoprotein W-related protein
MTEQLYNKFGAQINELTLITSSGGVFEVEVDGNLVYSKKKTRRHATFQEVHRAILAL